MERGRGLAVLCDLHISILSAFYLKLLCSAHYSEYKHSAFRDMTFSLGYW